MSKKLLILFVVAIIATAFIVGGCENKEIEEDAKTPVFTHTSTPKPTSTPKREDISIGLIYSGIDDAIRLHKIQLDEMKLENIDLTVFKKEVTKETLQSEIEDLSNKGCKIIFAIGINNDEMMLVVNNYPDIKFELYSGIQTGNNSNISVYYARTYQKQYINGMIAGYTTKSNNIGYIGQRADNENIRQVNAFALGVNAVNAEANVHFVLVPNASEESIAQNIAQELVDYNCDVITQKNISEKVLETAKQNDILIIGNGVKADSVINFTEPNFQTYMQTQIKSLLTNNYTVYDLSTGWMGMESSVIAKDNNFDMLNDTQKKSIDDKYTQIASNKWDVFTGPIKDKYGTIIVSEGMKLPDIDLRFMLWYVGNIKASALPAG